MVAYSSVRDRGSKVFGAILTGTEVVDFMADADFTAIAVADTAHAVASTTVVATEDSSAAANSMAVTESMVAIVFTVEADSMAVVGSMAAAMVVDTGKSFS